MTTTETIESITALVPVVTAQHESQEAAFAEQATAEAKLLERVVDLVRPALRALASKIQTGDRTWWPTNVQTATERTFATERGVRLYGPELPERDYPRANEGSYDASPALYLLADGTFVEKTWEGSWSKWQGASDHAEATLRSKTITEVVDEYDVDELVAKLADLLKRQVAGDSQKTTAAARVRAEKVTALTALL